MSKSTAHKALASCKAKLKAANAQLQSVYSLVNAVESVQPHPARADLVQTSDGCNPDVLWQLQQYVQTVEMRYTEEAAKARALSVALDEADRQQRACMRSLQNSSARIKDLKSDVSGWKGFTAIAFALGVAVGTLGYMAYLTQV